MSLKGFLRAKNSSKIIAAPETNDAIACQLRIYSSGSEYQHWLRVRGYSAANLNIGLVSTLREIESDYRAVVSTPQY